MKTISLGKYFPDGAFRNVGSIQPAIWTGLINQAHRQAATKGTGRVGFAAPSTLINSSEERAIHTTGRANRGALELKGPSGTICPSGPILVVGGEGSRFDRARELWKKQPCTAGGQLGHTGQAADAREGVDRGLSRVGAEVACMRQSEFSCRWSGKLPAHSSLGND